MTSLSASLPHPSAVELRRWTLGDFGELRDLRASLREALTETEAAGLRDLCDRMTVVATELATNALRHGVPPTTVRLLRQDGRLIIDVADHDLDAYPYVADDRPLGAGGLGLQLTKTFAGDVGWYTTDVAKHVWAGFPG